MEEAAEVATGAVLLAVATRTRVRIPSLGVCERPFTNNFSGQGGYGQGGGYGQQQGGGGGGW
jgi:hypothetical protein